ncbi:MAG: cysteine desulfurase [Desulfobacteraceae bacterium]|nr:cysteine desulfurase [Desulfobacteraceae bacterium]
MKPPIYLDYNGTTPLLAEVVEAMRPYMENEFGNPSSNHWYGKNARQAVDNARALVAGLLNCRSEEIFFTSGGTESNNHAICGVARALAQRGRHIITSAAEHPAVLEVCRYLKREGVATTYLDVDSTGLVDPAAVAGAIRNNTVLVTIMHANNEVGTIQPISEIAAIAVSQGIFMHTDAAQSVGKIVVQIDKLGVDLLSVAGHKLYAPKGVGALYVRKGVPLEKFIHGAGQERGRRAGTENVMQIAGLGKACEIALHDLEQQTAHLKFLRERLHKGIIEAVGQERIHLNGHVEQRLPNTLSIAFKGLRADKMLEKIGGQVAVSAGAACHSETVNVSHVLAAMKVPAEYALGTLRFSVGRMTTVEQIDQTIKAVSGAVKQLTFGDKA